MMVKYQPSPETDELIACFPEADVVLLEGFKYSEYPKIEVIRRGNSSRSEIPSGNRDGSSKGRTGCGGKRFAGRIVIF